MPLTALDLAVAFAVGLCVGLLLAAVTSRPPKQKTPVTEE